MANLSYAPQPPGNITENDNRSTTASVTGAPNPVSLISFTAQKEAQTAVLSWATAEEVNSDRFEVEHSLNGKNWQMIGSVAARGNSKNTQWYTFTDANPADGSNLYRLRMVDRDGTFDYTRARSLEFDIKLETALYPNPVSERLLLKAGDLSQIRRVELYNASGKSVLESDSVTASGIDVKGLPTGFYVVRVTRTNGSTDTFKVLKQ
ncbi:T9SS type A sorting domain-containing protein [Salmonirosea aquatica]|uniref:T9SS type A sorting domain-containing protein n=1 Tax=Salmonirosea aquatica TaxID=2654236 RepID=A0A7C9FPP4_9BACT|nr:T9SS type A sorting domain-containing protein [Cytophagaceae bacterium SJW1-29]